MAIKSGLTASADEVMNMAGKLFKNQAQLIFNADLIGLDSDLDEEYENLKRDAFATTTNIDSSNSYIKDVPVFGANVMDDFQSGQSFNGMTPEMMSGMLGPAEDNTSDVPDKKSKSN